MSLAQVVKKELPKCESCSGWRFLINCRSGTGLCATVACPAGEQPEFLGLLRGPEAAIAVHAKSELDKLPELQGDPKYEVCLLSIPGLLTEAFWLQPMPNSSNEDQIVPFFTAQKGLQTMKAYLRSEFLDEAIKIASDRLGYFRRLKDEQAGRVKERLSATNWQRDRWRSNCK